MTELGRVLVTGAGGFIGRHLVAELLARGVEVVALLLPKEAEPTSWGARVDVVRGDIRQLQQLELEVGPLNAIFHLAALVSDWGAKEEHVAITVEGTRQAIALALARQARFVVTTSVAVYGDRLASGQLRENMAMGKPASAYEYSKQLQEQLTLAAISGQGLLGTIIRPGNVYGVGSVPWVKRLLTNLEKQQPLLLGTGQWDAGLCHVHNLISALLLAAHHPAAIGQTFNIADGFGVTWHRYLNDLAQMAGLPPPRTIPNWLARWGAPLMELVARLSQQPQPPVLTRLAYRLIGGPNEFMTDKAHALIGYRSDFSYEEAMNELYLSLSKGSSHLD